MILEYTDFVAERHRIWEQRQTGNGDWSTVDQLLQHRKFTNVFRVLDYGSQFLLKELLGTGAGQYPTPTALLRSFLYRYTNRPEPWEWYLAAEGRYPTASDMESGRLLRAWQEYDRQGGVFFSSAYTMFSGGENPGVRRFEWAIGLAEQTLPLAGKFAHATGTQARVDILRTLPRVGYFMAQQVVTDFGYIDPDYDENDWVAPGPGSLRGAAIVSPGGDFHDVVDLCQDSIAALRPEVSLSLPNGGRRTPSLMDVQNTLCEFDKYIRWVSRPLPANTYQPKHPGTQPVPTLPLHWKGQNT